MRGTSGLAIVVISCASLACGGGGGGGEPGAPQILELSTNASVLHEDGTLVVTALVTDPDGIDDVIGGSLATPDGAQTYAAFVTAAQEGAYTLSLTWADLDAVTPIDAPPAVGEARTFRARFYDQAGHKVEQDLTVTLACGTDGDGTCDGACTPLGSDLASCGVCGRGCVASFGGDPGIPGLDTTCEAGVCSQEGTFMAGASCTARCAEKGAVCPGGDHDWGTFESTCGTAVACVMYESGAYAPVTSCDEVPGPSAYGAPMMLYCYCSIP